ncbi:transcription repressor NadR [Clostridium sp.]|jgi:uncharacterized protein|uniref:transcription repressor NadR n=1 Tax=Clostridium sp. TaxID=1506 RepID=UPI0039F5F41A
MDSKTRREYIKKVLNSAAQPKKGQKLAEELGVTRQVIVKDIAILRASGIDIMATPEGYIVPKKEKNTVERIIAVNHRREEIRDELETIVKYGGIVKDVVVEHSLYGEIKAMLMIKTLYDVQNFVKKIEAYQAKPLSSLTRGIHLHTIETENETDMEKIIDDLKSKRYLVE